MCSRILASIRSKSASDSDTPVGEVEVVVEAVLDRRPDRDLHPRVELHHGRRQHVRGVVADQPSASSPLRSVMISSLAGPLPSVLGQRAREVAQLAVDLDRQRRPRQPGADRRGGVGAGGAVGQRQGLAVGKLESMCDGC